MTDQEKEKNLKDLRKEIKLWEKQFQENKGRKVCKNDIVGEIASKYKTYEYLKKMLKKTENIQNQTKRHSGKHIKTSPCPQLSLQEKIASITTPTPKKERKSRKRNRSIGFTPSSRLSVHKKQKYVAEENWTTITLSSGHNSTNQNVDEVSHNYNDTKSNNIKHIDLRNNMVASEIHHRPDTLSTRELYCRDTLSRSSVKSSSLNIIQPIKNSNSVFDDETRSDNSHLSSCKSNDFLLIHSNKLEGRLSKLDWLSSSNPPIISNLNTSTKKQKNKKKSTQYTKAQIDFTFKANHSDMDTKIDKTVKEISPKKLINGTNDTRDVNTDETMDELGHKKIYTGDQKHENWEKRSLSINEGKEQHKHHQKRREQLLEMPSTL